MTSQNNARQPEAFSRVLIDRALSDSGWNLLNPKQVQFEFHTASGRADYLLIDSLGRTLCILEAKREETDPGDPAGKRRDLSAKDSTLICLLLLGFTGYLSPGVDEHSVLGV